MVCAIDQKVPLSVQLPSRDRPEFIDALASDFKVVTDTLVRVQAEKAEASKNGDKDRIFAAIKASSGGLVGSTKR